MNPQYAPSAGDSADAAAPEGGDFDTNLRQLDEVLKRSKAAKQELAGRQAMATATQPYTPPAPPGPEAQQAMQAMQQGAQALQMKEQAMGSALKAATQNLDPIQKAALAMKLQQNALALATGRDTSEHLEMPLDPRSALLSSAYGAGGNSLGDPFGGAARILASLGPQATMPRSTLDIYHQMQMNRPNKIMVQIHHGVPEENKAQSSKAK